MKEKAAGRALRFLLVGSLSAAALTGCGLADTSAGNQAPFDRCYTAPRPVRDARPDTSHDTTTLTSQHQEFKGPTPAKATEDLLHGAAVKIEIGKASGSGVLVQGPDGVYAVTAAHVAGYNGGLGMVQVTDSKNHHASAVKGCYLFEDASPFAGGNKFADLNNKEAEPAIDVAVLKLDHAIGTSALRLAKNVPQRGEWIGFINYQDRAWWSDPHEYAGVVGRDQQPHESIVAFTGVQTARDLNPKNYTVTYGASGGMAVSYQTGQLYGITTSMPTQNGMPTNYTPPELEQQFGLRFNCSEKPGTYRVCTGYTFDPTAVRMTPASYIGDAMTALANGAA